MCFTVDDPASAWVVIHRVARKPHACYECQAGILPGEHYRENKYLAYGQWERVRTCRRCICDRDRIIVRELAEGCERDEAEPMLGELGEALYWLAMEQTPVECFRAMARA